jgi:phosphoglycolate phosphatase
MPKPSLILFDMDGTLLDTLGDIAASLNQVLAAHGLPTHSEDAYRMFVGDGIAVLVERAIGPGRADIDPHALTQEMREVYAVRWAEQSRCYDGIPEALDRLVAAGIPMGILSNKPHDFTLAMAKHYLSPWPFIEVRGHKLPLLPKPDPQAAQEMLAAAGVDPRTAWYVGDTHVDIETGRRAGMISVGVTWGFRDEAELRSAGADHIVHDPAVLAGLAAGFCCP